MLYRETGQFKTSYAADAAVFPILQDRIGIAAILALAFLAVPLTLSDFWISAVLIPILVFSLAAIGLNLLTGYAGQISLGTGAFMGVGAYERDRKSTRLNSSHANISYAVFCLKKKKRTDQCVPSPS